jgi:hypothetical protein
MGPVMVMVGAAVRLSDAVSGLVGVSVEQAAITTVPANARTTGLRYRRFDPTRSGWNGKP